MEDEGVTPTSNEAPVTLRAMREEFAAANHISRVGLERAAYILRIAEDERMPQDLRDIAALWVAKIDAGEATTWTAYQDIRWHWRRKGLSFAHTCPICGARFHNQRDSAVYCSNRCRQKAYRQRGGE